MSQDNDRSGTEEIPKIVDLSIVDIKNEEHADRKGCFIGIGTSGYQIAKRLSEKYFHIPNPVLSRTTLNISHESGEFPSLLNQKLSHLKNQAIVIISGSITDPNFHSLRNIALSENLLFLWTILDAPNDDAINTNTCGQSFFHPKANESITIIPHGSAYVEQSFALLQAIVHCLHGPGFLEIDIESLREFFTGHWTNNIILDTNIKSYAEDIQRLLLKNKYHLHYSRSAVLLIFFGSTESMSPNIYDLIEGNMSHDPNLLVDYYAVDGFDSRIYVDIIFERVSSCVV